MYFLNNILKVLDIDEEIDDILPTELITMNKNDKLKIFNNFLDFTVITKSGKIIIFEFKKNSIRSRDLKQVFDYYRKVYCKEKIDVESIIIVIPKSGNIKQYCEQDVTFHPRIIKTKNFNKQREFEIIKEKFKNNVVLTRGECSLLIALPLFELIQSESEVVEEICYLIGNKKECIPSNILNEIVMGMYLNIVEYVGEEKQKELIEVIQMAVKIEGAIAKYLKDDRKEWWDEGKKEGREEGMDKGRFDIVVRLLERFSVGDVSEMVGLSEDEIYDILDKNRDC